MQSLQKCFSVPANCIERGKRSRASDLVFRKGLCLVIVKLSKLSLFLKIRKSWLPEHLRIKRIVDRLNHSEEGVNVDGAKHEE